MNDSNHVKFSGQAAGHDAIFQITADGTVLGKPVSNNSLEQQFYENAHQLPQEIQAFLPEFMGSTTLPSGDPGILLRNVHSDLLHPSILDLKLGSILHFSNASPSKIERMQALSASTTSGSLGVRISGMRVVQPDGKVEAFGKVYGRSLTPKTIHRGIVMATRFLELSCRMSVLTTMRDIAIQFRNAINNLPGEYVGTSLLFAFDQTGKVKGNWIDFAHSQFSPTADSNQNLIQGAQSTVEVLDRAIEAIRNKELDLDFGVPESIMQQDKETALGASIPLQLKE
jgi:hypothetical protein